MSTGPNLRPDGANRRSRVTEVIVDFLEDRGVTSYRVKREPSSITLSLPDQPESAVEHHLDGLRQRLQDIGSRAIEPVYFVSRDPRDQHAIIIDMTRSPDHGSARELLVQQLRNEEAELRRRGIESLTLFGSASTLKANPHDVDLLARFRRDARLSAFDLADIQLYLERHLGRRVDLSDDRGFPANFLAGIEQTGIRIFGS